MAKFTTIGDLAASYDAASQAYDDKRNKLCARIKKLEQERAALKPPYWAHEIVEPIAVALCKRMTKRRYEIDEPRGWRAAAVVTFYPDDTRVGMAPLGSGLRITLEPKFSREDVRLYVDGGQVLVPSDATVEWLAEWVK